MSGSWAIPSPAAKYGIGIATAQPQHADTPHAVIAGPSVDDANAAAPWHPDSPLLWFGIIAAAAVGLMGVSTHVRVGPAAAGASLGKD